MLCERCRKTSATVHVTLPLRAAALPALSPGEIHLCILCGKEYFESEGPELLQPYLEVLRWRAEAAPAGPA